jgi:hypothetical protein
MIAFDLEFGPNTDEAHKKVVYGLFEPRQLLSAYRAARSEYGTADLALVCLNMDPADLFAGPRVSMSEHLCTRFKFPAPLVSAHSIVKAPRDDEAFWLIIPGAAHDIPIMIVMRATKYEQVPEGVQLTGEA